MSAETTALLDSYLKQLKLPTMAKAYPAVAREAATANQSYPAFLTTRCEQEVRQPHCPHTSVGVPRYAA